MLNAAPLRRLGLISYGAYLFHEPIHSGAILALLGYASELPLLVRAALDFGVTVLLAELSWRLLETPFRNLARRKRPAITASAAT
jgi:peptidoglycan/LPS O-acetylase OafA/YrhL